MTPDSGLQCKCVSVNNYNAICFCKIINKVLIELANELYGHASITSHCSLNASMLQRNLEWTYNHRLVQLIHRDWGFLVCCYLLVTGLQINCWTNSFLHVDSEKHFLFLYVHIEMLSTNICDILFQLVLLFKEKPPKGAKKGADSALALIRFAIISLEIIQLFSNFKLELKWFD